MKTKVASSSWLIAVLGVMVIWLLSSLTLFGFTPFALETGIVSVLVAFIGTAFLASEIFMEGKVKSLQDLQTDTIAAGETVLVAVNMVFIVICVIMGGIPTSMRGIIGVVGIISVLAMVYELRR